MSCKILKGFLFSLLNLFRNEKQEKTLKERLSTIKRDKEKIQKTIGKLEKYKLNALDTTYRKVNVYVMLSLILKRIRRDFW
jgi:hypothetical protein